MLRLVPVLLALLLAATAEAQNVPPRPSPAEGLVIDRVGILSAQEEAALERRLVAFDDTSSSQIVVVILPDLGGADAASFAIELGRQWGVGQADFNNGVVVLVAINDRQVFIATGYGLEGAIPDALAGRIVRERIVPAFRQERYYAGLASAVDGLIAAAAGEYQRERRPTRGPEGGLDLALFVVVIVILLFVVSAVRHGSSGGPPGGGPPRGGPPRRQPTPMAPRRRHRRRAGPGIIFIPGGFGGFGGGSSGGFGGGGFGGGGFGGGGFGGFGGGSFGGGGAGGSW